MIILKIILGLIIIVVTALLKFQSRNQVWAQLRTNEFIEEKMDSESFKMENFIQGFFSTLINNVLALSV